ncbi:MAG: carboxypeptidase-like regulatory domain-containing protein [Coriobacteriia bacterium]|nr:carboxypeptidase-like regulatory domain-containing protein [Coriobacteriia bacterium]
MLRRRTIRGAAALLVATALMFAWVAPAQALFPIIIPHFPIYWFLQGIQGTVTNSGNGAPVSGIVVSAYDTSDGSYQWSDVTNSAGQYSLWLANGTYRVQFRDPAGRFGEQWWGLLASAQPNYASALNLTVSGAYVTGISPALHQAATIKTVVRRFGHPMTMLPGQFVIVQQKDGSGHLQQWSATTGSDGAAAFSGLPWSAVTYKESAIDPTGRFYAGDASSSFAAIIGGVNPIYIDLSPAGASREITPTVPAAKYSEKKNVAFSATGGFSKSLSSGSQIKILAVKGGTSKTFGGKIKSNKYKVSVKLAKGTWTLYALFGGNSTFAANDSYAGKSVKVK